MHYAKPPPPKTNPPRIRIMKIGGLDFVFVFLFIFFFCLVNISDKSPPPPFPHIQIDATCLFVKRLQVSCRFPWFIEKSKRIQIMPCTFLKINPSLTIDLDVVRWSIYNHVCRYVYTNLGLTTTKYLMMCRRQKMLKRLKCY